VLDIAKHHRGHLYRNSPRCAARRYRYDMAYAWLAGTEFAEEREKSSKPVQPTGYREATGRVGDDRSPYIATRRAECETLTVRKAIGCTSDRSFWV
jgi:hypothetical protein